MSDEITNEQIMETVTTWAEGLTPPIPLEAVQAFDVRNTYELQWDQQTRDRALIEVLRRHRDAELQLAAEAEAWLAAQY